MLNWKMVALFAMSQMLRIEGDGRSCSTWRTKGTAYAFDECSANSLCVLTTREPDSTEAERIIFAVFLVDDTYDGDEHEEGFVSTQSKFKLSSQKKQKMLWRYHNENK